MINNCTEKDLTSNFSAHTTDKSGILKWWSNIECFFFLSLELNPDPVVPQSGAKKGQDGGVKVSTH